MPDQGINVAGSLYPEGLLRWAGHRDGGVKKPFRKGSGRPTGTRIQTPLLKRLRDWAIKLVNGDDVPRSILLVGGPGNGKTDAIEGLVEDLDEILGLNGSLFNVFGSHFLLEKGGNPPRRVDVNLEEFIPNLNQHLRCTISVVQDATEADSIRRPGISSQAILLEELEEILSGTSNDIYLCCVNRGKLAEVSTEAHLGGAKSATMLLLDQITKAVTCNHDPEPCWPLRDFQSIAAWPMDVDSLVETADAKNAETVVSQILFSAVDSNKWPSQCPAGDMCPFCLNKKLLEVPGTIDRLAEMLRAYELGTGKRWTFRDLYSLVPYMLVGDEEDFRIDNSRLSPCEWAAKQLELMESSKKSEDAQRARALHLLVDRLFWHRLFPLWPRLTGKVYSDAKRKVLPIKSIDKELGYARDHFRYLDWIGRGKTSEAISRLVSESFCSLLDPADATPDVIISKATTRNLTVRDIDEYYSLSVGQGLGLVTKRVTLIERELLKRLAKADEALGANRISATDRSKAEVLQQAIRLYASRLTKRSLGVQSGVYAGRASLVTYREALHDPGVLRTAQAELKKLINDQERNLFIVPLMTTFAQPLPPRHKRVSLETTAIKVLPRSIPNDVERPPSQLAYLDVDGNPVPLTYELYNALQQLNNGMHPGSLKDEVFAMVDRVRARAAGNVVRDRERLLDDAVIYLESTKEVIKFDGDTFSVEKREAAK